MTTYLDKLVVVDLTVTIDVSLADHLVDLVIGKLFAEVGHTASRVPQTLSFRQR